MKKLSQSRSKRCLSCKELFDLNPRTKSHQRYCSKADCQKVRQRLNEQDWRKRNPDCVTYQQEQSRRWYKAHPNYSRLRRKQFPKLLVKNRQDTCVRMQNLRAGLMFDKSKSILKQLTGRYTDKCYLARGSRWIMVRLTKASPLSRLGALGDNRNRFKSVINHLPRGRLYDLSGVF
jgi:hypothetical protein